MYDGRRDVEQAVDALTERLPATIRALGRVAYDYRWSWAPDGPAVFRDIDPVLWARCHGNPRAMIERATPRRLRALSHNRVYIDRVAALDAAIRDDRDPVPPVASGIPADRPVAYFCSEFGLHHSLPLYGGGLGVLAGDVLKAASDLAVPMVGVGLLYREGYFHQRLDVTGWQHEYWTPTDFADLPLALVTGGDGEPLTVAVRMRERTVRIQIWRLDVGRVPLYLLDTDRPDNDPIDRWITARLYIGDRHTRLVQYGVLGVGGTRALAALGIRPSVFHLNEGHAALSSIERLRERILAGETPAAALEAVRAATVFTTHTPVAAGNEGYGVDEVEPVLGQLRGGLDQHRSFFYGLGGWHDGGDGDIAITPLALRTSRTAIGVSRRHGEMARGMWHHLWPDRPVERVPIGHVTNGVHTATWMAAPMQALLDAHLGADWRRRIADRTLWERIAEIPDAEIWAVRRRLRAQLVEYARERSVVVRLARGDLPGYVEAAARVFDPDVLTIGFARRVATYKRLHLFTRRLDRGLALLANDGRPIQVVFAGKAHPQDEGAKRVLQSLLELRGAPHVGSRIAFLDDYDLEMASHLVSGADLWVNVPRPPLEASGTSGMKAALNGALNLSVLDGWWIEGQEGGTGWSIATPDADPEAQDEHDATALYDALEQEVVPLFYERAAGGVPGGWVRKIKTSMQRLIPRFSAERMVREYVAALYEPP